MPQAFVCSVDMGAVSSDLQQVMLAGNLTLKSSTDSMMEFDSGRESIRFNFMPKDSGLVVTARSFQVKNKLDLNYNTYLDTVETTYKKANYKSMVQLLGALAAKHCGKP